GGLAARRPYRGDDARAVRAGLRRRIRDGHLLHQPADCAWSGRACSSAPRPSPNAGVVLVLGRKEWARGLCRDRIIGAAPWNPTSPSFGPRSWASRLRSTWSPTASISESAYYSRSPRANANATR